MSSAICLWQARHCSSSPLAPGLWHWKHFVLPSRPAWAPERGPGETCAKTWKAAAAWMRNATTGTRCLRQETRAPGKHRPRSKETTGITSSANAPTMNALPGVHHSPFPGLRQFRPRACRPLSLPPPRLLPPPRDRRINSPAPRSCDPISRRRRIRRPVSERPFARCARRSAAGTGRARRRRSARSRRRWAGPPAPPESPG